MAQPKKSFFFLFCFFISKVNSQELSTLKIGDLAPSIQVLEWLKGSPINSFHNDHIYVVEFTGSQCVPCRAVAPHLSELAKKYLTKVSFMGICVGENFGDNSGSLEYVGRVKEFVRKMGKKMNYSVAVDGPQQIMYNTWLKASNEEGIPVSFVINQKGRIAWIGHPIQLENILPEIIANDNLTSADRNPINTSLLTIKLYFQNGNQETGYKVLDSLINSNLNYKYLLFVKFKYLLKTNKKRAYQFGQSLINEKLKDPGLLEYCGRSILYNQEADDSLLNLALCFSKKQYELAIDTFQLARSLILAGQIYDKQKKYREAMSTLEKAINFLSFYGSNDQFVLSCKKSYYELLDSINLKYTKRGDE